MWLLLLELDQSVPQTIFLPVAPVRSVFASLKFEVPGFNLKVA